MGRTQKDCECLLLNYIKDFLNANNIMSLRTIFLFSHTSLPGLYRYEVGRLYGKWFLDHPLASKESLKNRDGFFFFLQICFVILRSQTCRSVKCDKHANIEVVNMIVILSSCAHISGLKSWLTDQGVGTFFPILVPDRDTARWETASYSWDTICR